MFSDRSPAPGVPGTCSCSVSIDLNFRLQYWPGSPSSLTHILAVRWGSSLEGAEFFPLLGFGLGHAASFDQRPAGEDSDNVLVPSQGPRRAQCTFPLSSGLCHLHGKSMSWQGHWSKEGGRQQWISRPPDFQYIAGCPGLDLNSHEV